MHPPVRSPTIREWTLSDTTVVRGRVWAPESGAADVGFIYLHGIQSHGGWYQWSASLLARAGPVLLPDRRGSGLNRERRGDTPSLERWLEDIDELADWMTAEFGVRRYGIVGVSWGAKLAVAWTLRRPDHVEKLLLVAPGIFPAVGIGSFGRIRVGLSLVTRPQRELPIPLSDPRLFTQDAAGQAFIDRDPLKLTHATARFFYQSRLLDRRLVRIPPGSLRAAVTLVLVGRDRIIRNDLTQQWLRRISASPPTVRSFPRASHTIEFEQDRDEYERLLMDWATGRPH